MEAKVKKHINEGAFLFMKKEFKASQKAFEKALKLEPENVTALNNLGYSLLAENNYKMAFDCFLKANEIQPKDSYTINLGHCMTYLKNYESALQYYTETLQQNPSNLAALESVAALYEVKGQYQNAIRTLEKIITSLSSAPKYKIKIAQNLIALEQYDKAITVLNALLEVGHESMECLNILMHAHYYDKNFKNALRTADYILQKNPKNKKALHLSALIYLNLNEAEKAFTCFNDLLSFYPSDTKIRLDRAIALLAYKNYEVSISDLNFILENEPSHLKAMFYKSLIYFELNKHSDAINLLNAINKIGLQTDFWVIKAKELLNTITEKQQQ